jgi:heterodisulfide reductase subunit A-like polyferredoxin
MPAGGSLVAKISVLGGGLAGLVATEMLSPFHSVTVLESADSLGGLGGGLSCKAGGDCTVCSACLLPELVERVSTHENVTVRTGVDLEEEDLEADALIVATGLEVAEGIQLSEYGAGRLEGVVTALEMDRRLRTAGEDPVRTPALKVPPEGGRIAIVQCVCSRDTGELPYCSRVCCAYSARLAMELRETYPDLVVDVFYMDLQREDAVSAREIDEAMATEGIEYIRSRPAAVQAVPGGGLEVLFEDTLRGEIETREYMSVVLSTGLAPSTGTRYLAGRLGLSTDDYGFLVTDPERPSRTSVPNVFAAGGATGPVDLVEASMGGMAAAAAVLGMLPPEWPGYPPRAIVIGGGPVAEDADSALRAAGADTGMVIGVPGKGLQRLEGEPLGFLARMGGPGSDAIFKLKGDMVIIVPEAGEGSYGPVPEDAKSVAVIMGEGPKALYLATSILDAVPEMRVDVLYREMQVAHMGMQELQLELAIRGVGFHRYKGKSLRTEETEVGSWEVSFVDDLDPGSGTALLMVDHVARPEHREAGPLVWPWFLSRHAPEGVPARNRLNVMPVLTPRRGVYTTLPSTVTTTAASLGGHAAAAMALHDFASGFPPMEEVAVVDPDKCAACLNCLRLCPHDAIVFDEEDRAAVVLVRACQDCGLCRGICPAEAIEMVPSAELEVG